MISRFLSVVVFLVTALRAEETQVLVYGATPAGIAASLAAAKDGESVLLVEPTDQIGGMVTSGLSHTDFRTFEGLTGSYLDFTKRVEQNYRESFGANSAQVRDSWRGTFAEPKVNLAILEKMLADQPKITVWKSRRLFSVHSSADGETRAIGMAAFLDNQERTTSVSADVFIDASYEGDLLAAAKVPYRVGREGRQEYGESLAPGNSDNQLQAYNFRLTATQDPANRVKPKKPKGFRREDYAGIVPLFKSGKLKTAFGYPDGCVFKAQVPPLPNAKYDINDVSGGLVRLSLPGENMEWPDGGGGTAVRENPSEGVKAEVPYSPTALGMARGKIFDDHLRWNVGLLYFLQNVEAVPAKIREEAATWGWCRDEFSDNAHLPPQLYVREARRMVGARVFTERDTDYAPNDARSVLQRDSIAIGDYGPNCHGTGHEGSRFGGRHTGEFYKKVAPYQIPYGTLIPKDVENLLVPVAASSSHVGYCALRLEPIWMSLGEAAGHAAHLVRANRTTVQRVNVAELQARLHRERSATIYISDVLPGHADFDVVQWWGTAGGLHGLAPTPPVPGQRGSNITGQYFEAFPNHTADLDLPINETLRVRWMKLASEIGIPMDGLPPLDEKTTRGEWLRAVFAAKGSR
ncbi:MAG TPA: FAD-dependent oxidoreductase [Chthoniobacteraceae bacterium]|nr:FAD-dependent oxidoreductase [Chthoniobacteraceae bacterium]